MAVIDGGATKTFGSLHAVNACERGHCKRQEKTSSRRSTRLTGQFFGFGNSSRDKCCSTVVTSPEWNNEKRSLGIHVLDKGTGPILVSVATLRRMKAIIDYGSDTAVFAAINPNKLVSLPVSTSGHQLMPLTHDFVTAGEDLPRAVNSLKE
jgi:hypothetical protein